MNKKEFKFIYFATGDILIPRAERIYAVRFCEAIAERGVATELVSLGLKLIYDEPTRFDHLEKVYGIQQSFEITVLPTFMNQNSNNLSSAIYRTVWYSLYSYYSTLIRPSRNSYENYVIYFQNYPIAPALLLLKKKLGHRLTLIFEARNLPANSFQISVLRSVDAIAAHTRTLYRDLTTRYDLASNRICAVHMGVSLDYINSIRITQQSAREKLGVPQDYKVVVYTGKVFKTSRVVSSILRGAKLLPPNVRIVIVGGRSDQMDYFREKIHQESLHNVQFVGFIPPGEVMYYQFAADVLLMDSEDGPTITYASPGKLFEYMATKVPIVAADHDCFKELLNDRVNAMLFEPDNAAALAQAIMLVLSDEVLARRLADQSYCEVQNYTWMCRANAVLDLLNQV